MVEILIILNSKANYILLDEPFKGLSPIYVDYIKNLIKKTSTYKGIIITDHDYKNVLEITSRNLLLHEGCLLSLNSVSELIYQDQKKAEIAVIEISKFLRNAINKKSLVTLESELLMVKTYVNIENVRFDEKIVLNIEDFSQYKNIEIPKFSIQLLVENAIKHGFLGKELNINIKFEKDKIIVLNDGKLTSNLKFGTGLSNLQKRLNLQKVGKLLFENENEKMKFTILLKDNI